MIVQTARNLAQYLTLRITKVSHLGFTIDYPHQRLHHSNCLYSVSKEQRELAGVSAPELYEDEMFQRTMSRSIGWWNTRSRAVDMCLNRQKTFRCGGVFSHVRSCMALKETCLHR